MGFKKRCLLIDESVKKQQALKVTESVKEILLSSVEIFLNRAILSFIASNAQLSENLPSQLILAECDHTLMFLIIKKVLSPTKFLCAAPWNDNSQYNISLDAVLEKVDEAFMSQALESFAEQLGVEQVRELGKHMKNIDKPSTYELIEAAQRLTMSTLSFRATTETRGHSPTSIPVSSDVQKSITVQSSVFRKINSIYEELVKRVSC